MTSDHDFLIGEMVCPVCKRAIIEKYERSDVFVLGCLPNSHDFSLQVTLKCHYCGAKMTLNADETRLYQHDRNSCNATRISEYTLL